MTSPDLRPDADLVPPALLATPAGLSPERLRELLQAEDAYAPRPGDHPASAG